MPRILFLLFSFFVVFSPLQAEEKTTDVFGRVTKMEEVTDDGVYLIACTLNDGRFVLLTNMVKTAANKLVGSWMQEKPEKELTYTNVTRMWRITRTEHGTVRITSAVRKSVPLFSPTVAPSSRVVLSPTRSLSP